MDEVSDVAVVTVGTNDGNFLAACFATLSRSSYRRFRVFYSDNGSTDGSLGIARSFDRVTVVENGRNVGAAAANNAALSRALAELPACRYVLLLNPDTRTPAGMLGGLVAFMDENPSYGGVGPLQHAYGQGTEPGRSELNEWSRRALAWGERHEFSHRHPARGSDASPLRGRAAGTLEHPYVQSSALLLRVEALRRAGFLDEHYETYYEELDLCRRLRWCGYRVALLLDHGVEHLGGGNTRGSAYRDRRMVRNKYYYLWTDPTWGLAATARLTASWLRTDLRRLVRPRPRDEVRVTPATAVSSLVWLVRSLPRTVAVRRRHRDLRVRHAAARERLAAPPPPAAPGPRTAPAPVPGPGAGAER